MPCLELPFDVVIDNTGSEDYQDACVGLIADTPFAEIYEPNPNPIPGLPARGGPYLVDAGYVRFGENLHSGDVVRMMVWVTLANTACVGQTIEVELPVSWTPLCP